MVDVQVDGFGSPGRGERMDFCTYRHESADESCRMLLSEANN
jgi:hypothetical protein